MADASPRAPLPLPLRATGAGTAAGTGVTVRGTGTGAGCATADAAAFTCATAGVDRDEAKLDSDSVLCPLVRSLWSVGVAIPVGRCTGFSLICGLP